MDLDDSEIYWTRKQKGLATEKETEEYIRSLESKLNKEKEKNKELVYSVNQLQKECNEENRRCMLLAVENQDLKEKNERLRKCHLQYEEMTGIDLLLPEKEE